MTPAATDAHLSTQRWLLRPTGAEAVESGGQMFNPPHINSIAVPGTERRPFCRMVAAGRGDGAVVVYDADAKARLQPSSARATWGRALRPLLSRFGPDGEAGRGLSPCTGGVG